MCVSTPGRPVVVSQVPAGRPETAA
jgi:hypothetical protein